MPSASRQRDQGKDGVWEGKGPVPRCGTPPAPQNGAQPLPESGRCLRGRRTPGAEGCAPGGGGCSSGAASRTHRVLSIRMETAAGHPAAPRPAPCAERAAPGSAGSGRGQVGSSVRLWERLRLPASQTRGLPRRLCGSSPPLRSSGVVPRPARPRGAEPRSPGPGSGSGWRGRGKVWPPARGAPRPLGPQRAV